LRCRLVIALRHSDQRQDAALDGAARAAPNTYFRVGHALDEGNHDDFSLTAGLPGRSGTSVGFWQDESVRFGPVFGGRSLEIMRSRLGLAVSVALLASTAFASSAFAQTPGNAEHGKDLANTCLGCHGVPGYRNAYPNYSVPKLEGQHPEYIVPALQAYRSGDRSHLTMHSQASSLSDQDMADIAAYFSGKPVSKDQNPAHRPAPPP